MRPRRPRSSVSVVRLGCDRSGRVIFVLQAAVPSWPAPRPADVVPVTTRHRFTLMWHRKIAAASAGSPCGLLIIATGGVLAPGIQVSGPFGAQAALLVVTAILIGNAIMTLLMTHCDSPARRFSVLLLRSADRRMSTARRSCDLAPSTDQAG